MAGGPKLRFVNGVKMKTWSALQNSWLGLHWTGRLSFLGALCLGVLLLTLYLQVLHLSVARVDQLRLGQRTTTNTLAARVVVAPH
jgi:hypothetical protein